MSPEDVRRSLAEALPDGLDILDVVEASGGSLADRLEASHWELDVAAPEADTTAAVEQFLATESVLVERMTKKGLREFDCRAAVDLARGGCRPSADPGSTSCCATRVPAVRPDDVLSGLARVSGLVVGESPLLTRLAQGPLDLEAGSVGDPLHSSV